MTLPTEPPRYNSWSDMLAPIKRGEFGWRVWALQKGLDAEPNLTVVADGAFGPATEAAVKKFQASVGLDQLGFAGPGTQRNLLDHAERDIHAKLPDVPEGVLLGFTIAEGASLLAPTNWYTPPGGVPGVDCGPVQWRQKGPPFNQDGLKKAFDARSAFTYAGDILLQRMADYNQRRPALSDAMVLRIAILAHNAPFLSEQVVKYGKLSTPDKLAEWTVKPGGGHYTHAEWLQEYPDRILMYVK